MADIQKKILSTFCKIQKQDFLCSFYVKLIRRSCTATMSTKRILILNWIFLTSRTFIFDKTFILYIFCYQSLITGKMQTTFKYFWPLQSCLSQLCKDVELSFHCNMVIGILIVWSYIPPYACYIPSRQKKETYSIVSRGVISIL